ncbi:hypothetical protein [Porphyrobacter sp. TH134]|uniref:hypothetical protein n=1 Tax=Porphyrobacter sp. TH134 TaxID=2067450 RepID=UPI00155822BC|nr:hypothetical protein [Porphyrobacter sp. TH134]
MIVELNNAETSLVAGGSIMEDLEDQYPGGVWVDNSYFPNGTPKPPIRLPLP